MSLPTLSSASPRIAICVCSGWSWTPLDKVQLFQISQFSRSVPSPEQGTSASRDQMCPLGAELECAAEVVKLFFRASLQRLFRPCRQSDVGKVLAHVRRDEHAGTSYAFHLVGEHGPAGHRRRSRSRISGREPSLEAV